MEHHPAPALAGLWHGANWTFVVFGTIHGVGMALERYIPVKTKPKDATLKQHSTPFLSLWRQRIVTFHIVCLSVIFFRAASLPAALHFLAGTANFSWRSEYLTASFILCLFTVPLFLTDLWLEAHNQEYLFATAPYAIRTGLATAALVVLALFSGSNLNAFIYFQF